MDSPLLCIWLAKFQMMKEFEYYLRNNNMMSIFFLRIKTAFMNYFQMLRQLITKF